METTRNLWIDFVSLIALGFIAIIFYIRHSLKKNTTSHPLPPGPKGYPVIGCLPEMIKNKPVSEWINKLMQELNTEIASIRLGNTLVIPVTSPDLAREFLKKHDAEFSSRPDVMSARLVTKAVIFTPWEKIRKVVVSEVISPYMHQWVLNQCEKGSTVNLREVTQHYCGNMIRRMMFNKRFFGSGTEDGGPGFEERAHMRGIFNIIYHNHGFAIADYAPWSEVLINLKNSKNNPLLSIEEIKALAIELNLAAIDNPSIAVEWAMAEMLNQSHILGKAIEELDRVVGKKMLVQESDLPNLKYLKTCLKEGQVLHETVSCMRHDTLACFFDTLKNHKNRSIKKINKSIMFHTSFCLKRVVQIAPSITFQRPTYIN